MSNPKRVQGSFTSRTKARKRAADVIFEGEQRGYTGSSAKLHELLTERRKVTAAQTPLPEYSQVIIAGVADDLSEIDAHIQKWSKVKALDRLPGVDLAVLRVAVWEMLRNFEDVDRVVSIDEAVAIVKSISTDRSPAFVNAVLDAIRLDLENKSDMTEERISKQVASVIDEDLLDELLDEY